MRYFFWYKAKGVLGQSRTHRDRRSLLRELCVGFVSVRSICHNISIGKCFVRTEVFRIRSSGHRKFYVSLCTSNMNPITLAQRLHRSGKRELHIYLFLLSSHFKNAHSISSIKFLKDIFQEKITFIQVEGDEIGAESWSISLT